MTPCRLLSVPVQEPVLRHAHFDFGWPLSPRFPDVRGALTDVLRAATGSRDEWSWDSSQSGPAVVAWNEDARLHLIVTGHGMDIVTDVPDIPRLMAVANEVLAASLEILAIERLSHCGAGATWTLAAADSKDAEAALERWLFGDSFRSRLEPLGGRPDDINLRLRFENNADVYTTLGAEPVTDEQAAFGPYFPSDLDPSDFPPGALLVNINRRHEAAFEVPHGIERAEHHLDQLLAQAQKLLASVDARDDGLREASASSGAP